jgi:hypothetical protein
MLTSARPRDSLCHGVEELTILLGTEAMLPFVRRQLAIRFGPGPLAGAPCGVDAVQPGTRARHGASHAAPAACLLDTAVVRREPCPPGRADVPRGLVPPQPQRGLPCRRPRSVRHPSNWGVPALPGRPCPTRRSLPWVSGRPRPSQALAWGSGAGRSGAFGSTRTGGASVQAWSWGGAAPPHRRRKAQPPVRLAHHASPQPSAPLGWRAAGGAGRGSPCCARGHWVCRRGRARRMLAARSTRAVRPCS